MTIEELTLLPDNGRSIEFSTSLKRFVRTNPNLRKLRFGDEGDEEYNDTVFDLQSFQPIAEALVGAVNVTEIQFRRCNFEDIDSVCALKCLLAKSGLQKFTLDECTLVQTEKNIDSRPASVCDSHAPAFWNGGPVFVLQGSGDK